MSAFQLQQVTASYSGQVALRELSVSIQEGEQVAIVGPSGGGKTTFLRLLNAAVAPAAGKVFAMGQDLAELSPGEMRQLRAQLGFIPQSLGLVPGYRVLQNVLLGRVGQRSLIGSLRDMIWPASADVQAVYELLAEVGIPEKIYERCSSLSGGQMQRVAIGRSLFQKARCILADEPVSSVDPSRARSLVDLLMRVSRARGITLVMSLHQVELAKECFPRVIGLRQGRLLFDSAPSDVSAEQWAALFQIDA
jgi:phosphonate transport system ATP-binding protein